jgi:hypothetical protein
MRTVIVRSAGRFCRVDHEPNGLSSTKRGSLKAGHPRGAELGQKRAPDRFSGMERVAGTRGQIFQSFVSAALPHTRTLVDCSSVNAD